MVRQLVSSVGLAAVVAAVASLPVAGQGAGAPGLPQRLGGVAPPPLVVTAYNGGAPVGYTAPRTPWGEPDLQGVWSSDDTEGIPRERPANLGTQLYMNDQAYAARVKQVAANVVNRENNATSTFRNDFARRAFRQTSIIVDPPDGRMPAVTPAAEQRRASRDRGTFGDGPFNTFEDFTLYDRCITRGVVGSVLRVIYGNGNRIVQGPGMVAITYEMIHDTRVMYTDGRTHIGQGIRQYLGDSRARWEGDELVVETTNFTDKTSIGGNGNGLRHSDQMKIVERFRRVADDVLQYQFTVDDPITYVRPFTMSFPLTPLDGGVILPYECHEGNQAVRNALSAERTEDKAIADDLARGIIRVRRPVQGEGRGGGGRRGGAAAPGGRGGGRGADPEDAN
jgi:hypothetical protein